ncbi:MAG: AmmeMemoRadiSam system radical SAM enzyme [Bacteroidales bacterium]|nr:AmmeMemoRadiSam system radical SAM enzyme [Bacteroidales bacterium]
MNKREFLKRFALLGVGSLATAKNAMSSGKASLNFDMKTMKEAMYYQAVNDKMMCELCPHECSLIDGQTGICRTRKSIGGKLIAQSYGKTVAVNLDPVEKKPFYHFLPQAKVYSMGTAGCNFRCLNCQNWEISQNAPGDLPAHDYSPNDLVNGALSYDSKCIAYTYTEPTVFYEYMLDTAVIAHQSGLKNLMVSNGFINPEPLKQLIPYLDAVNIDLKAFDADIYRKLAGGTLEAVKNTLLALKNSDVWLEITHLMVPGYSDDLEMFRKMIQWLVENEMQNVPLHISRFFPAHKLQDTNRTEISTMEKALDIAKELGIQYVYTGNVRDTKWDSTYCYKCGELLIERSGYTTEIKALKDGKCGKCGVEIPGVWK